MDFTIVQVACVAAVFAIAICSTSLASRLLPVMHDADIARDAVLDGMRGIAAIGVVACHLNQHMVAISGFTLPPLLGDHVGIIGVQMFFALTAYLFVRQALSGKLDPAAFYIGRIRRILPLYTIVCLTAFVIVTYFTWQDDFSAAGMLMEAINTYLYGFTMNDPVTFRGINMLSLIGISWTLTYEWVFYLLLIPAFHLWKHGAAWRICLCLSLAVLAAKDFILQNEQVVWPFFLPGIAAALFESRMPRKAGLMALYLSPAAIALICWLPGFWTPIKLALVSIVFFGIVFGHPRWLCWWRLQALGASSYSIYLIQYLVIFIAARILYGSPSSATVGQATIAGSISVVLIVVLGALSFRFIERRWMTSYRHRSSKSELKTQISWGGVD